MTWLKDGDLEDGFFTDSWRYKLFSGSFIHGNHARFESLQEGFAVFDGGLKFVKLEAKFSKDAIVTDVIVPFAAVGFGDAGAIGIKGFLLEKVGFVNDSIFYRGACPDAFDDFFEVL